VLIFDPVSHFGHYLKVAPEHAADTQRVALTFEGTGAPTETTPLKSGSVELTIANRTSMRLLPVVWTQSSDLVGKRKPHLTAKRIFTNQTFRELYRTDTLAVAPRFPPPWTIDEAAKARHQWPVKPSWSNRSWHSGIVGVGSRDGPAYSRRALAVGTLLIPSHVCHPPVGAELRAAPG
jgi:hypothetical protein